MSDVRQRLIEKLTLVSEQRQRVRELSGFRKNHSVPTENSDRTREFVGRIAAREISEDLDAHFDEFRRHLSFRRVDLHVSEPEDGGATILTPWFEYRVTVTHAADDAATAVWRREVSEFREPEPVFSSAFAAVFGRRFDTVELELPEPIPVSEVIDRLEARERNGVHLEYDRTATWCRLVTEEIPGHLLVRPDRVALVTSQPQLPALLLESFFRMQRCLTGISCF